MMMMRMGWRRKIRRVYKSNSHFVTERVALICERSSREGHVGYEYMWAI